MFLMYYEGYVLPSRTTKLELGLVKFYVKKEKRSKMRRLLTNPRHFGFFSPGGGIRSTTIQKKSCCCLEQNISVMLYKIFGGMSTFQLP